MPQRTVIGRVLKTDNTPYQNTAVIFSFNGSVAAVNDAPVTSTVVYTDSLGLFSNSLWYDNVDSYQAEYTCKILGSSFKFTISQGSGGIDLGDIVIPGELALSAESSDLLIYGLDSNDNPVPIKVNNDGTLPITTTITTPEEFSIGNLTSPGIYFTQDVTEYSNATVTVVFSSFTGTIIFEASSNNTNWSDLECRVTTPLLPNGSDFFTGAIPLNSATGVYTFALPVFNKFIRMRLVSYTSGSLTGDGSLYQLRKDVGGVNVTGSSVSIAKSTIKEADTAYSTTDKALVVTARDLPIELSGSISATGNVIESVNVSGYQSASVQISGTFTGNVVLEGSDNNTVWYPIPFQSQTQVFANINSFVSSPGIFDLKLNVKFFRIRVSSYTSGTISVNALINKFPITLNAISNGTFSVTGSSVTSQITSTTVKDQIYIQGTISSSGDNPIIASPGAGQRIYITVLTIQLEAATATTVLLKRGATTFKRFLCVAQGDGLSLQYSPGFELKLGANEAFTLNLSGANTIGYSVEYYIGS